MTVQDLMAALKTAEQLATNDKSVRGRNNVYVDPPSEPMRPLDHTTGVVEAAAESREKMVERLFNYAKPKDMRKQRVKTASPADETLGDRLHRVTGLR